MSLSSAVRSWNVRKRSTREPDAHRSLQHRDRLRGARKREIQTGELPCPALANNIERNILLINLTRRTLLSWSAGASVAAAATTSGCASSAIQADEGRAARRTLIKGVDILSMDPKLGELFDMDVVLENGRIAAIGKRLVVDDARTIDARGMILMPGMVDGHRHVWESVEAGRIVKSDVARYGRDYHFWKMKWMAVATDEDNYLANFFGGLQAIDSGVTSIVDHAHGQPTEAGAVAAARGLKDSGIAGYFAYQIGHAVDYGPGDTRTRAQAFAQMRGAATPQHWSNARKVMKDVLSDQTAPLRMGIALSNGAWGRPVSTVKAEEIDPGRQMGVQLITTHMGLGDMPPKGFPVGAYGHRELGVRDLYEGGCLDSDIHFSHGTNLSKDEFSLMRQCGCGFCSCCMGEMQYRASGKRGPAHARAHEAGVATGMGIDVGVALPLDYFEHARAALWSLYTDPESTALSKTYKSEDTLAFATRQGAAAIRLGDLAGTVTVGKRADLVLLSTARFDFPDVGSLADRVLNFAGTPDIDSVWVAGRLLKSGGKLVGVDLTRLKVRTAEMRSRLGRQMDSIKFT